MSQKPTTQQFRRNFSIAFLFRISPGFFVVLRPRRRWDRYYNTYDDDEMVVRRISENQYRFLCDMGIPEGRVMMQNEYGC